MDKVINKTVDVLSRLGEKIERQLSPDEKDGSYYEKPSSEFMYAQARPVYRRPLDKKNPKNNIYSKSRNLIGGNARKYSSDNLAASPGYSSFNNYRQNPERQRANDGAHRPPYGTGIGAPLSYGFSPNYGGYSNASAPMQNGSVPGNIGYAPDYYIAERRQLELVPAPKPQIIQQQVPVPVAVDRPVPQPYPVQVPVPYAVDRPVPVPVPSPVPFDRPVPVPVPVAVQSPPVYVQVPVPCYVPVAVPVPSPPPSPVVYEQSVTHTQRWTTGSPAMVNQQSYAASSPVIVNQQSYPASSPVMVNQQSYPAGSPVIINQQSYPASSSATGLNPYGSFGNGSFVR